MNKNVKIKLNVAAFRDKVYACWVGKNIGGTMGAPYEGKREYLDVRGFATAQGVVLPNDDLDLQLVWLHAVEQLGPLAIDAATLGEFWLSYIVPHWNEYGLGKNNMVRGLLPPLSGDYENNWRDSNGAWIRTEIWACLAPASPASAARYATEDAKVDHGAGEGSSAAAFVAAMQSAAFAVKDLRKCIEIGLGAIPASSRMADSVRFILECFDSGMAPLEAREAIFARNADIGDGWFEAPTNVSYALIGLLWGGGDLKKSIITACNCGDDTDCTCATVGATLGILGGMAGIPEDWRRYIGDEIITVSVNKGDGRGGGRVPKTCTELSERVCRLAPHTLFAIGDRVRLTDGESKLPESLVECLTAEAEDFRRGSTLTPYQTVFESDCLVAEVVLDRAPDVYPGSSLGVTVKVSCRRSLGDDNLNLTCRWWLPEGFTVSGKQTAYLQNKNAHTTGDVTLSFTLTAGESVSPTSRAVLEITAAGRPTVLYCPILLLG